MFQHFQHLWQCTSLTISHNILWIQWTFIILYIICIILLILPLSLFSRFTVNLLSLYSFSTLYIYIYTCMRACVLSRFSCVRPFVILRTVPYQAALSMEFSRQEYWSGLSFPSPAVFWPRDITHICLRHWQEGSLPLVPPGTLIYMYAFLLHKICFLRQGLSLP